MDVGLLNQGVTGQCVIAEKWPLCTFAYRHSANYDIQAILDSPEGLMNRDDLRGVGIRLLLQAQMARASFPSPADTTCLDVVTLPVGNFDGDKDAGAFCRQLGYLHDEVLLVWKGQAGTLTVLDDEIARTEFLLSRLDESGESLNRDPT